VLLVTKLILKKVVKNLDPCNPYFFHDKSKLEVICYVNYHINTVSGSGGG
jgi:hypothetical protein